MDGLVWLWAVGCGLWAVGLRRRVKTEVVSCGEVQQSAFKCSKPCQAKLMTLGSLQQHALEKSTLFGTTYMYVKN